jgi:hypothetical protein
VTAREVADRPLVQDVELWWAGATTSRSADHSSRTREPTNPNHPAQRPVAARAQSIDSVPDETEPKHTSVNAKATVGAPMNMPWATAGCWWHTR